MARQSLLRLFFAFFFFFGLTTFLVSLYGAIFLDWPALQRADAALRDAGEGADLRTLFVFEARQNIHRLNLFAEGVWALLGAILTVLSAANLARVVAASRSDS